MARKPAHLELAGGKSPRQRIWEQIRLLRRFTLRELRGELPGTIPLGTIRSYVEALHAGGFLALTPSPSPAGRGEYTLAKDTGAEAPRVRKDGTPIDGTANERIWGAMEALGSFNARVLASMAGAEIGTVKTYCLHLRKAGFLTVEKEGRGRGNGGVLTTYRLLKSKVTGPRPPMITRLKTVYDPNVGRIVWQESPEGKLDEALD